MSALENLLNFPRFGEKGVNERMEKFCTALHSRLWWRRAPCIKIAGSNGKGTTANLMSQMAQNMGKKVGLYTSPHLLDVTERIQINSQNISENDFEHVLSWALNQVKAEKGVGRFEVLTLAALYYFAINHVDIAVMEVGLGGRFDPVRIAPGRLSLLTSIDLEHTAILGNNLEDITREKAAICKAGDCLITGVAHIATALPKQVEFVEISADTAFESNTRLAQQALKQYFNLNHLPPQPASFILAGRMDYVSHNPQVLIDVAHSPKAIEAVLKQLPKKPIHLICGARNDKDIKAMADVFSSQLCHVIAFCPEDDMLPAAQVLNAFEPIRKDQASHAAQALEIAQEHISENHIILCLGGFDVARHMLAHFKNIPCDNFIQI